MAHPNSENIKNCLHLQKVRQGATAFAERLCPPDAKMSGHTRQSPYKSKVVCGKLTCTRSTGRMQKPGSNDQIWDCRTSQLFASATSPAESKAAPANLFIHPVDLYIYKLVLFVRSCDARGKKWVVKNPNSVSMVWSRSIGITQLRERSIGVLNKSMQHEF